MSAGALVELALIFSRIVPLAGPGVRWLGLPPIVVALAVFAAPRHGDETLFVRGVWAALLGASALALALGVWFIVLLVVVGPMGIVPLRPAAWWAQSQAL